MAGAVAGVGLGGGAGASCCDSTTGGWLSLTVPQGWRTLPRCTVTGSDADHAPAVIVMTVVVPGLKAQNSPDLAPVPLSDSRIGLPSLFCNTASGLLDPRLRSTNAPISGSEDLKPYSGSSAVPHSPVQMLGIGM